MAEKEIKQFTQVDDLKSVLGNTYMKQITNFFDNEKQALRFLSAVTSAVQRLPKLLDCTPVSVINSFMMMAQLGLMPSDVSGEAYVLPYENKKKDGNSWIKVLEAQFQLGYQGIVTLLYRAGAISIVTELVRKNDVFRIINGMLHHEVDPFKTRKERGEVIGAYAIINLKSGGRVEKFMRIEDILEHGKKFSKSFSSDFSPWNAANDPEGWMLRKTVLKQAAKLAPKNETLNLAIAEDNKDSIIADRLESATHGTQGLTMGSLLTNGKKETKDGKEGKGKDAPAEAGKDEAQDASEGVGAINLDGEKV